MTGRPLLITDCDEVLLHMVAHFQDWLGEAHDIDFAFETGDFAGALTHRSSGVPVTEDRVWPLLTDFFRGEMHRQTLVPGALEALGRIGEVADIVILTNLGDEAHGWRVEQLAAHGIAHEVVCNQGGKGVPARAIIDRHRASASLFVDDLPVQKVQPGIDEPDTVRSWSIGSPQSIRHCPAPVTIISGTAAAEAARMITR